MSSKYSEPLLGRDADEESLDITPLECPTNGDRLLKASLVANFLLLAICVLLSIATVFLASPGDSQQITDNGHLLEPYCELTQLEVVEVLFLILFSSRQ